MHPNSNPAEASTGTQSESLPDSVYRQIFNASRNGMAITDFDTGRILDVNTQWTCSTGIPRMQAVGRTALELGVWADPTDRETCIAAVRQTGRLTDHEAVLMLNSNPKTHLITAEVIQPGARKLVLWEFRDISERRQAEARLEESERNYREIFNSANDAIFIHHPETGAILDVNDAVLRLYGFTRQEALKMTPEMASLGIPPYSSAEVLEWVQRAVVEGPQIFEWQARKKSGELFWVEVSLRSSTINGESRILAMVRDISERKSSDSELERQSRLHQLLLDNIPGFVFWKDRNLRYLGCNKLFASAAGLESPAAITGKTDFDLAWSESAAAYQADDRSILQSGIPKLNFEEAQIRPDGSVLWLKTSKVPLQDEGGGALGILGVYMDITQQKETESALRSASNRMALLFNGARDATFIADVQTGLILDANQAAQELVGISRDKLVGMHQTQLHPPESAGEYRRHFESHARGECNFVEALVQRSDGSRIPVEISTSQVTLDSGQRVMLGLFRDISERKRAEKALAETEARFHHVIQTAEVGYFRLDRDGLIQSVNPAWLRMHGFASPSEVIGRHFEIVQVPGELAAAERLFQRLLVGETVPSAETSRLRKDGSVGYHLFSVCPIREQDQVAGVEGFLIDTTDLRQARTDFEMLFTRMIDAFAVAEVINDSSGNPRDLKILSVNPAFEKLLRLPASRLVGNTLKQAIPNTEDFWINTFAEVARTGIPASFDRFSREIGRHLELGAYSTIPGQVAVVIIDVTEKKQLEKQFLQAQKMEAVGQLAGGVAHDFNNILASIMLNLGLLREEPDMPPIVKESVRELEVEARRAASLTRQLLMFSRRSVLEPKLLDVNVLIQNLLKMLRRLIGEHVSLDFVEGSSLPPMEADPGMIEQILLNLCVNARDAMPKGGQIMLSTSDLMLSAQESAQRPNSRPGWFICITVSDSGTGMDEETQKRIFEPFFTTKEPGKGTGLGLATVYGIVVQHHGWIELESEPGRGTTFRILLPASNAKLESLSESAETRIVRGTETILLVEDDPSVRRNLAQGLRLLGYKVLDASNGPEAMQVWEIHAGSIDLLLSDMVMPHGMSGLDLTEKMRTTKPGLKVIISSGYSTEMTGLGNPAAQGIVYLPKPYQMSTLWRTIRLCLDGKNIAGD